MKFIKVKWINKLTLSSSVNLIKYLTWSTDFGSNLNTVWFWYDFLSHSIILNANDNDKAINKIFILINQAFNSHSAVNWIYRL